MRRGRRLPIIGGVDRRGRGAAAEPAEDGESMPRDPHEHAGEQFCYLTTTGRVTGRPHEVEIWFAYPPIRGARST